LSKLLKHGYVSGNYKGLVTDLAPNADITVDRFHMKVVNEELDAARRDVKKTTESLSDAAKVQLKTAYTKVSMSC